MMRVTFQRKRAGFGSRTLPGCSFLISSECLGPRTSRKSPSLPFTPACSACQVLRICKNCPVLHTLHGFLLDWSFKINFCGAVCASSGRERRGKQRKYVFGNWSFIYIYIWNLFFFMKEKNNNKKDDFFFLLGKNGKGFGLHWATKVSQSLQK